MLAWVCMLVNAGFDAQESSEVESSDTTDQEQVELLDTATCGSHSFGTAGWGY